MKNIQDFIFRIKDLGVTIKLQNEDLKIIAPKNVLTTDIVNDIKRLKVDIIDFLKRSSSEGVYESYTLLKPAIIKDYYPLSSAQKRLYLLQQMDLKSVAYNISHRIKLEKGINKNKVEEVFLQLISRHESLRTSFKVQDEEPVQFVHEKVDFKIEEYTIEKTKVHHIQSKFIKAFNLTRAPLFRVAIVEIKDEHSLLMIDLHHIISDGVSLNILEQEFQSLYLGKELSPLRLQYKDYSEWQNGKDENQKINEQEVYWLKQFEEDVPILNLSTDYIRPLIQSFEGANVSFALSKEETENIKLLAEKSGITLYMSILSVFSIFLSKLSGQEDVIVGTPIAGRNHADLEQIVGMFINMLALRNKVVGNETLKEFVQKLKQITFDAYENQDYQFEDLVEKISINRDASRNPIFDVVFNLLNQVDFKGDISEFNNRELIHTSGISKFDLTLTAIDFGEQLLFRFEYSTKLFKAETIDRFINYLKRIVSQLTEKLDEKILNIEIITEEEKLQLLYEFNDTKKDYPRDKTIHQLFEEQVKNTPNNIAVVFKEKSITYTELNEQSNRLAWTLFERGVKVGNIVGLHVEHSFEVIVGIFGILKAGACYLPIDISYPKDRKSFMIEDSKMDLMLVDSNDYIKVNGVKVLNLKDKGSYSNNIKNPVKLSNSFDLAYLIYTSGSTGKPKGVMICHDNVVNYIIWAGKTYNESKNLNFPLYSSISFDLTVTSVFTPLLNGALVKIYSLEDNVSTIFEIIRDQDLGVVKLTPSHLEMISEEDLSNCRIRSLIVGGEELKTVLASKIDSNIAVYNEYGPTESTVGCMIHRFDPIKDKRKSVSIGRGSDNHEIYILDKYKNLVPIGVPGELCISGDGLALGYLNNVELTSEKFIDSPFKEDEKLYCTGDLACWLPGGNIEFLGRIDDQVKIRGFRIELGEIENVLQNHESIKENVVIVREDNGDKYLCAYIVIEEVFNQEEIHRYLSANLPEYMIPSYFVEMDTIPLTTNGKVNRKALPLPEVKAGDDYVAASNEIEEKLVEIWSGVLNVAQQEISTTANFFNIGGHSLKASLLTGRIHKKLGVEFPLRDVFLHSSIKAQAYQIEKSTKKEYVSIPKAKYQNCYSLSSAQKRLFLQQQIDLTSKAYNMPNIIPLGEEADKEKIREVFIQLISRHESFRTSFEMEEEKPVQRIHEQVDFKLDEFTIEKEEVKDQRNQFIKAFDLTKAPLLRVAIVNIKGEGYLLMIDMHHIISDGVSHSILEKEFNTLYSGEKLPPLFLQYKDYSEWQNSKEQRQKIKEQELFWLKQFEGDVPILNLSTDYIRPLMQSFEGANVSFSLSKEETDNIKLYAEKSGITLYMSILSVFNVLLSKLSGQEDIIVGTPSAGRNHADLEQIVGVFINMLAIRNKVDGNQTLREFTEKLKQTTFDVYDNQDFQFEDLIEKLSINRDTSRNPIFDVVFNLLNQVDYKGDISEFNNQELIHTSGISKFDLTLNAVDSGEQLLFRIEYCTKLFKAKTIERFINYFKQIVSQLNDKLNDKISTIEIITGEEKQQLLYEFNNTICDYPKDKTIQQLFEEQVSRLPDKVALSLDGHFLRYQELNDKANSIANNLRENGISRDDIVIIFLDRSFETVFSMLGILKSGGAYLPIDPDYPKERIDFILNDSQSRTIITTEDLSERIEFDGNIICVEDISISSNSSSHIESINKSSDLAYIIYTSGTTGKPKGVMIEHRNVVRLFFNDKFQFDFSEKDVWTMFHSHCFDFSVWEMYGALLYGGKLIIIPKIIARDTVEYYNVLSKEKVTVLNQTPSAFYNLAHVALSKPKKSLENLRYLIFGGEALKPNKLKEWFDNYSDVKIINMFGITETTVHVTYKEIGKNEIDNNISNIGTSIPTLTTYVVDKNLQLVPKGFSGELLIGGDGVGRGYLGREDLTSEKFIMNPYKPEERLYRSGDLVKMLSNGEMEYLGRIDNQVQLRGFRIELGEIESVLQKHENIKEGVVVANEKNGEKYLCAYIAAENGLDQEEIRTYLSESLPDYMIPSYFMELEALPLTSNGKVNLKILPSPEVKVGDDYVSPTNEIEEKLVEIWSEILKVEKIGIDNNYFSLGGDSITALRLISAINKRMNVNVRVSDLYVNQTIRLFSKCISNSVSVSSESIKIISIKDDLEKNKNQILSGDLIKNNENVEDIYPASDIQVGMIYYSLINPEVYHDQMVHVVEFPVMDTKLLDRALYLMMEKHSILRTGFYQNGNDLNQVVFKKLDPEIKHYNISDKSTQEQNDFIREYLYNDKQVPFDIKEHLWRFFTFDLGNNAYCICFICHHAIIDGWSDASFNTELNNIYLALQKDTHFIPEQLQSSYKDFVIDQIYTAKNKELTDFWKDELVGYKRFAFDIVDKDALYKAKREKLPDDLHTDLISIARQLNISVKNICLSAFMYTLKMFSYDNDITVGLITNNRPAVEDSDKILGCFLNTVPFRILIPENATWKEYISGINEKLNNLKKYDKISLLKIVELTGEVSTSQNPITDIIFNYVDFHIYDEFEVNEFNQTKKGGETSEHQSNMGGVQSNSLFGFDISVTGGNLFCSLSYITSFISEESVKDFFEFFRTILVSISSNSDQLIKSKDIISKDTLDKILYEFNNTKADYPKDKTIHQLFEKQVDQTPDFTAVVYNNQCISYGELNLRSNQLAQLLLSKGLKPEDIVGILVDRSIEMIIGILGILKAGGTYLPLDIESPKERIKYIIKESRLRIILSQVSDYEGIEFEGELLNLFDSSLYLNKQDQNISKGKSNDSAYIIYTSGSTGKPKGVVVEHGNVVNLINGLTTSIYNNYQETLHVSLISPLYFDASVKQIFPSLTLGHSLNIIPESIRFEGLELINHYTKHDIQIADGTPIHAQMLAQYVDSKTQGLNIRQFVLGGDELKIELIQSLFQKIDVKDLKISNVYGPTECTDVTTIQTSTVESLKDKGNTSIGKPILNYEIFILGKNLELLPVGVSGELCISGAGVSRGYLYNEALTSEKFIEHPYKEGERLYKTGDLARWLPDGNIEFLGRIDHQVKIRGFRIELGEIENVLLQHDNIKDTAVLAREEKGDKYLCAYLVVKEDFNEEELWIGLSASLPDYMIPSYFVQLEKLPLTSNGKVNRKALPSPEIKAGDDYIAPSNATEEKLVEIWSKVLKIEKEEISVTANFFAIGGHSLKAMIMVNIINKEFNIKYSLIEVYKEPTIARIAVVINNLYVRQNKECDIDYEDILI